MKPYTDDYWFWQLEDSDPKVCNYCGSDEEHDPKCPNFVPDCGGEEE